MTSAERSDDVPLPQRAQPRGSLYLALDRLGLLLPGWQPRTFDDSSRSTEYAYDGTGMVLARDEVTDGGGATSPSTTTYNDDNTLGTLNVEAVLNTDLEAHWAYSYNADSGLDPLRRTL
jgi:hypothetical protein